MKFRLIPGQSTYFPAFDSWATAVDFAFSYAAPKGTAKVYRRGDNWIVAWTPAWVSPA